MQMSCGPCAARSICGPWTTLASPARVLSAVFAAFLHVHPANCNCANLERGQAVMG